MRHSPVALTSLRRLLPETAPQRAISLATFANTFGSGLFLTASALYFTQIVHLSGGQYAVGIMIGSLLGLFVGLVAGRMADRFGPREAQIAVKLTGALGTCGVIFVANFESYVIVAMVLGVATGAHSSCQSPLIRAYGGDNPVRFRAYQRSLSNAAVALGALAAGVAIGIGSRTSYDAVFVVRAAAYVLCAGVLLRVPHVAPTASAAVRGRWQALRDRRYLAASLLNAFMAIHFSVPSVLLPLWVADQTHAPKWIVSIALFANTMMVVCLQVRVSKGVDNPWSAGRRMLWAGMAVSTGLVVMAFAHWSSAVVAVVFILFGIAIYTLGELWHAAAAMEYEFGLAAPDAQGQYSGVFAVGPGLAQALGPAVVVLALSHGVAGILFFGLGFCIIGAANRPLLYMVTARSPEEQCSALTEGTTT